MYVLNVLNMVYSLRFFSSKCSLFHNSNVFGSCIIHILYTGCAKIKKNNSGAKTLSSLTLAFIFVLILHSSVATHRIIFLPTSGSGYDDAVVERTG